MSFYDRTRMPSPVIERADPVILVCLGAVLFAATILQRFAIPMGAEQIPANLIVTLAAVAVMAASGRLMVEPIRFLLLGVLALYLVASGLLLAQYVSHMSLAFLLTMYACFIFVARSNEATYRGVLQIYQTLALVCAAAGIIQFFVQFVYPDPSLFSWEHWVPEPYIVRNFNLVNELFWGSDIVKTNGFFLLEASILSQYLALAIIIELIWFRPGIRLAVYGAALMLTYSGTGLSLLLLFLPWLALRYLSPRLLVIAAIGAVLVASVAAQLQLDVIVKRVAEFQQHESSGFARFIAPMWMVSDLQLVDTTRTLFGFGSGATLNAIQSLPYQSHDPTWSKLFFEYGLIGFVLFMGYFLYSLFEQARSVTISLAVLYIFMLLGGMLLDARLHAIILSLVVMQARSTPESMLLPQPQASTAHPSSA
ncbi:hypothetical protein [Telmatospirillum sp. J64-1]|uniref:hypothetical protein n=1 Tax=Telmatospirillum sp. J64-1 TaxID=2502183 RepID=UPI00115E5142|nr:hypothetical protein [Telmatospirillum sp. J64-1]